MVSRQLALFALLSSLVSSLAHADEGMWLFTDFPSAAVKKAYGFSPDEAWLSKVRLGSLRLANGCSASFVSARGLVMTNHHCIRSCTEDLSTPQRDLLAQPFLAKDDAAEERCPKLEANQLVEMTDVTARVLEATQGVTGAEYDKKLKAELTRLEGECSAGNVKVRCDVVTLFHGARFHLYKYRRFQDVRLVFSPEFSSAAFGGDPDNFNFPRYAFDVAFLRVYEDGQPAKTPEALRFARRSAKEGDLVFTSGHPGGTERRLTVSQLEFQRDVALPWSLLRYAEQRGRLEEWMGKDPERNRVGLARLRTVENGFKALKGRFEALVAPGFLDGRRAAEATLRSQAPEATRPAWDAIAGAMREYRGLYADARLLEGSEAFSSELFTYARQLVRHHAERRLPDAQRLREYTEARFPMMRMQLVGNAPVSKDLEAATLTWSLTRLRALKGADDPLVRSVLGKKSPEEVARALVDGTRLDDAAFRAARLADEKLDESDPMLAFAAKVDSPCRSVRKQAEERVDAVLKKNGELLAQARRAVEGTTGYPDATFTLRLSYGQVKGWGAVKPLTNVAGFYGRLTGAAPYAASERWLKAQSKLAPQLPFNLATTNDIIGGNSGSPLLSREGEVVGLVFDGNLPSLGGNFFYDGAENRAVAVHAELILAALPVVYGADRVVAELRR